MQPACIYISVTKIYIQQHEKSTRREIKTIRSLQTIPIQPQTQRHDNITAQQTI